VVALAAAVEAKLDAHFREFAELAAQMDELQFYRECIERIALEEDEDEDAPPPPPTIAVRLPTLKEVERSYKSDRKLSRKTRRRLRRQRKIFGGLE